MPSLRNVLKMKGDGNEKNELPGARPVMEMHIGASGSLTGTAGDRRIDDHVVTYKEIGDILLGQDTLLGVDYLELQFPIGGLAQEPVVDWRYGPQQPAAYGARETWIPLNPEWSKAGLRMTAFIGSAKRSCTIGFNPSTVLYGPGSGKIASLDNSLSLLVAIYEDVVSGQVKTYLPLEKCSVTRLDVAVDVAGVKEPERLYQWIQSHPHNSQATYNNWSRAGRQTGISSLPRSGGLRVYPSKGTKGKMRFEAQARTTVCHRYCPTVGDLSDIAIRKLFCHYFGRLGESLRNVGDIEAPKFLSLAAEQTVIRTCIGEAVLEHVGHLGTKSNEGEARRKLRQEGVLDQIQMWVSEHWK